jgi:hypothetical protein
MLRVVVDESSRAELAGVWTNSRARGLVGCWPWRWRPRLRRTSRRLLTSETMRAGGWWCATGTRGRGR